ncbi:MAG: DUF5714 domain-containing protein [Bacteroidota bacterium]
MQSNQCLICGSEMIYKEKADSHSCFYCGKKVSSQTGCKNNHFVCDGCLTADVNSIINNFCLTSEISDPIELATALMKHPSLKMHGQEHHFLVPAVLLKAYYTETGELKKLESGLQEAYKRSSKILENSCSLYGNCGAAVGAGIFISLIKEVTPFSETSWRHANLVTSESLKDIAENGGPRCCKRNSFLAIHRAVRFMVKYMNINISFPQQRLCTFHGNNKECIKLACPYYP